MIYFECISFSCLSDQWSVASVVLLFEFDRKQMKENCVFGFDCSINLEEGNTFLLL